uniref:Uncharacterized protein n=1 Tax=Triticum urartu TaxID=4572 RepID=A0A8R7V3D1_TRIUA
MCLHHFTSLGLLFLRTSNIHTTITQQNRIVVIPYLLPQALPLKLFWPFLLRRHPIPNMPMLPSRSKYTHFFSKSINLSYQVCTFNLGISIDRNEEGSQSSLL